MFWRDEIETLTQVVPNWHLANWQKLIFLRNSLSSFSLSTWQHFHILWDDVAYYYAIIFWIKHFECTNELICSSGSLLHLWEGSILFYDWSLWQILETIILLFKEYSRILPQDNSTGSGNQRLHRLTNLLKASNSDW